MRLESWLKMDAHEVQVLDPDLFSWLELALRVIKESCLRHIETHLVLRLEFIINP